MASSRSAGISTLQFTFKCCVRGYHYRGKGWIPAVGEELSAEIEDTNAVDQNAIALKLARSNRDTQHVGYLPREISIFIADIIRQGGHVACKVRDAQIRIGKGPEVPIEVSVTLPDEKLRRLKQLINICYNEPVSVVPYTMPQEDIDSGMPAARFILFNQIIQAVNVMQHPESHDCT